MTNDPRIPTDDQKHIPPEYLVHVDVNISRGPNPNFDPYLPVTDPRPNPEIISKYTGIWVTNQVTQTKMLFRSPKDEGQADYFSEYFVARAFAEELANDLCDRYEELSHADEEDLVNTTERMMTLLQNIVQTQAIPDMQTLMAKRSKIISNN